MDGSVWSIDVVFWEENLVKSYCVVFVVRVEGKEMKEDWTDTHLIGNDISMPRNKIKRTMVLLDSIKQPVCLVHNFPVPMQLIINARNRM